MGFHFTKQRLFAACVAKIALFNNDVYEALAEIGAAHIGASFGIVFVRAIFAGWLIALMVWLFAGRRIRACQHHYYPDHLYHRPRKFQSHCCRVHYGLLHGGFTRCEFHHLPTPVFLTDASRKHRRRRGLGCRAWARPGRWRQGECLGLLAGYRSAKRRHGDPGVQRVKTYGSPRSWRIRSLDQLPLALNGRFH